MNISKCLEEKYKTINNNTNFLSDTEKLMLAACYKSGKSIKTLSRLLNLNIQTVRNYLTSLKAHGFIRTVKMGSKRSRQSYIYVFDGTKEQLKKCPPDLISYVKEYWKK